jgi:nitrous-oxide reductase
MTTIRSHFSPDNIEGVKVETKFISMSLQFEQDFDTNGFAVLG